MARYIDADYLDELITQLNREGRGITRNEYNMIDNILFEFPTADVVEVVRCKECFYAIPYNEKWTLPKKNNCMWCKRYEDIRTPDWFCADGERRA